MHIECTNNLCPTLEVHGEKIEESEVEKYLGDILSNDCTVKATVTACVNAGRSHK